MTNLDPSLHKELADLFTPHMTTTADRQAILWQALPQAAYRRIKLDGPTDIFIDLMIRELWLFGAIKPEKLALVALLDVIRPRVGVDKQAAIDRIKQKVTTVICSRCGNANRLGANYCRQCRQKLTTPPLHSPLHSPRKLVILSIGILLLIGVAGLTWWEITQSARTPEPPVVAPSATLGSVASAPVSTTIATPMTPTVALPTNTPPPSPTDTVAPLPQPTTNLANWSGRDGDLTITVNKAEILSDTNGNRQIRFEVIVDNQTGSNVIIRLFHDFIARGNDSRGYAANHFGSDWPATFPPGQSLTGSIDLAKQIPTTVTTMTLSFSNIFGNRIYNITVADVPIPTP